MDLTVTGEAAAISPGKLYALGGTVSHQDRVHWVPKGSEGHLPLNCYLLVEGDQAMLIDTSLPIIEPLLVQQMEEFQPSAVKILLTRAAEFDSVGNAEIFVDRWPVKEVWSHYTAYEYMYLRGAGDLPPSLPFNSFFFKKDQTLEVAPGRTVSVISPRLRLLATAWIYDHGTGTLFTSDLFAHVLAPEAGIRVVTSDTDRTTRESMLEHMKAKFDYLLGADVEPVRKSLAEIFSRYDVQTIAPSTGCVISGRALCARHQRLMDEVLEQFSHAEERVH